VALLKTYGVEHGTSAWWQLGDLAKSVDAFVHGTKLTGKRKQRCVLARGSSWHDAALCGMDHGADALRV
jgi:hypothetical protein